MSPGKDSVLRVAESLGVDLNTTAAAFDHRFKRTFLAKESEDERNSRVLREKYKDPALFAGLHVADFITTTLTSSSQGILKQVGKSKASLPELLYFLVDKIKGNRRLPRLDWAVNLSTGVISRTAKQVSQPQRWRCRSAHLSASCSDAPADVRV